MFELLLGLFAFSIPGLLLLAFLWMMSSVSSMRIRVDALERRLDDANAERVALTGQVAALSAKVAKLQRAPAEPVRSGAASVAPVVTPPVAVVAPPVEALAVTPPVAAVVAADLAQAEAAASATSAPVDVVATSEAPEAVRSPVSETAPSEVAPSEPSSEATPKARQTVPPAAVRPPVSAPPERRVPHADPPIAASVEPPPPSPWSSVEAQITGNWTGVLGSVAVVLGVAFLGIYAALEMSPFGRFGLVVAAAAALFGVSVALAQREEWTALSLWVRSAAGTILLMGCVASVQFTPMRWVESDAVAMALVGAGVAVNLALGYLAGGQGYAAVHVSISLMALRMLPATPLPLLMATVVAGAGELVVVRNPTWGAQLAVAVTAFVGFHLHWFLHTDPLLPMWQRHYLPVAALVVIGLAALFTSYRRVLARPELRLTTLALHLWVLASVGASFALHDMGGWAATVGLLAASVGLHRASAFMRERGVLWLFQTDRLVSLALATGAAATLYRHGYEESELVALVGIPSLLWLVNEVRRGGGLVVAVALAGTHGFALLFALSVGVEMANAGVFDGNGALELAGTIAALLAASAWGEARATAGEGAFPSMGLGASAGLVLAGLNLCLFMNDAVWVPLAIAAGFGALIAFRVWQSTAALDLGLTVALAAFAPNALALIGIGAPATFDSLLSVAVLAVPAALLAVRGAPWRPWTGVLPLLVIGAALLVVSWRYTVDVSAFLPGILWLVISVAWLEVSNLPLAAQGQGLLKAIGAGTFGAFLVRHGLVDLQNEARVGPVSLRGAVELLAVGVAGWWAAGSARKADDGAVEVGLTGWFLEAALALLGVFIALEVPGPWIAPALLALAFALTEGGALLPTQRRMMAWGIVAHDLALLRVAFLSARLATPSFALLDQAWVTGLLTLLGASLLFVRWRMLARRPLAEVPVPPGLQPLAWLVTAARAWTSAWLLYPVFAALAVYLAWTFSHGVLTFLWMSECFGMFVCAIVLRDEVLRRIAMLGVVVVLGRLMLFDLRTADVLVRALVFLGSGGLLLAINALYHRFRDRFAEPTEGS